LKKKSFIEKLLRKSGNEEEDSLEDLNIEKQDMIRGIVELSKTTVKEIMVPRIDVVSLPIDMPIKEMVQKITECGHSRFPVYKKTIDNIIGMLYVKDLLPSLLRQQEIDIDSIIRKPYFVPESIKLDSLLRELQKRRVHISVVVDEYGGISGIVCLEDIIEEIVGDIQDEFDNEQEDILEVGENTYLCDARVDIEDLNEELQLDIPENDFDTLGGFVFDLFGKIPVKYEKVTYNDIEFIIQDMDGYKIKTVKINNLLKNIADDEKN
jgi:magnesium and cobalt transporter